MATVILVAGAWHGGWCWNAVAPLLRAAGHEVLTPDLPGTGSKFSSEADVGFDDWCDFLADLIVNCEDRPFVVGHSRGGIVISQTAELVPDAIGELIYLSAALLPAGTVPIDGLLERMPGNPSVSQLPRHLPPVPYEDVRQTAFNDCSEEDARSAYARLTPEPVKPLTQALNLSEERFGSVPRSYIECLNDNAVTLEAQRAMQAFAPCQRTLALASGHSPFLSMPEELAEVLAEIVAKPLRT